MFRLKLYLSLVNIQTKNVFIVIHSCPANSFLSPFGRALWQSKNHLESGKAFGMSSLSGTFTGVGESTVVKESV